MLRARAWRCWRCERRRAPPRPAAGRPLTPLFAAWAHRAAVVLFSGLGSNPQESLKVGVGTLAGSTIMLLTVPWAMCQVVGRVDLDDQGRADYAARPKCSRGLDLFRTGVACSAEIPANAKIMLATAGTYLLIQGPAFALAGGEKHTHSYVADHERWWAFAGFITAVVTFFAYSIYMVMSANALEQQKRRIATARKEAFRSGLVGLDGMREIMIEARASSPESAPLRADDRMRHLLRPIFNRFDADGNGTLDEAEVRGVFEHLHIRASKSQLNEVLTEMGGDDAKVSFDEFCDVVLKWGAERVATMKKRRSSMLSSIIPKLSARRPSHRLISDAAIAEETDGDVEMPGAGASGASPSRRIAEEADDGSSSEDESDEEDEAGLTPGQIKFKSAVLLTVGVVAVTLFSDPMVNVMAETGSRLGISPFYVAFVVSPVASNASEFISSMVFASRRTKKSMTLTFSALLGAATMNNSFCLSIFLALVYFNSLAWTFSAETTAILVIEICMCVIASKRQHPTWKAIVVFALFPLSILLVWFLENILGWD